MTDRKTRDIDWPYSLLDVIVDERDDMPIFTGTQDQIDGLQYALSTLFERECKCLLARYRDGETLVEAGKTFGVTRERIRQIEAKALRKLKHPSRMAYIRNGLYGEEKRLALETLRAAKERAEADAAAEVYQPEQRSAAGTTVEEMGLSVRSYNCLKRAGIERASDLMGLDYYQLLKIRNLGKKSVEEITATLHNMGLRGGWEHDMDGGRNVN